MAFGLPHREARAGEVWVANVTLDAFESSNFKTKRRGIQAYDVSDRPIRGGNVVPLFVQTIEMNDLNIPIPDQTGTSSRFGGQLVEPPVRP